MSHEPQYAVRAYHSRHSEPDTRVARPRSIAETLDSEEICREILEKARWPGGPVCMNCGAHGAASRLTTRPGLWTCKACRRCQYSVTSGTQLHRSRLPVSAWVKLFYATEIRKQNLTASQVSRRFNVAYLTAKSMLQRVEALKRDMPEMAQRLEDQLRALAGPAGQS
ncbi:transposase [Parvibaculum sp.]|uniref:transposase n=1 Tax=Parvibaculum sp. TaxID=2024848 RepID=UPI002730533D|nr:transposase [Parvibaculum sp.]MDP1626165.1 transposase [Parvibaculum sp.]MDP2151482.1 transposase [Parvibaculum sp.]MDP3329188.1 transposase [Parvibaculum sp.]